jgi:hypothetical protein
VNGIISNSFTPESTLVNSAIISDVKGECVHRTVVELRETIQGHLKKDNPYVEHKVIVIEDSNMKGVASTLQTLLGCNYKFYSIVKPGSNTNELLKTAKETIKELTQKDIIVLCYGTNDLNQRNVKKKLSKYLPELKGIYSE